MARKITLEAREICTVWIHVDGIPVEIRGNFSAFFDIRQSPDDKIVDVQVIDNAIKWQWSNTSITSINGGVRVIQDVAAKQAKIGTTQHEAVRDQGVPYGEGMDDGEGANEEIDQSNSTGTPIAKTIRGLKRASNEVDVQDGDAPAQKKAKEDGSGVGKSTKSVINGAAGMDIAGGMRDWVDVDGTLTSAETPRDILETAVGDDVEKAMGSNGTLVLDVRAEEVVGEDGEIVVHLVKI